MKKIFMAILFISLASSLSHAQRPLPTPPPPKPSHLQLGIQDLSDAIVLLKKAVEHLEDSRIANRPRVKEAIRDSREAIRQAEMALRQTEEAEKNLPPPPGPPLR